MIPLNTIQCRDCLEGMREIPDKSIDLVITDPPYGIDLQPQRGLTDPIEGDNQTPEEFNIFLSSISTEFKRVLKDDTFLIIFCGWSTIPDFRAVFDKQFTLKSMPIWVKNNFGIGYYTRPQYEPCLLYFNGKPAPLDHPVSDVWFFDKIQAPEHSCQKPVPLIEFILNTFSKKGDVCLDSFMGWGTTAIAAIKTERNFIGFEKDQSYFDAAQIRIKKAMEQGKIGSWFE